MKYLSILSVKLASLDIEENLDSFLEFGLGLLEWLIWVDQFLPKAIISASAFYNQLIVYSFTS